MSIEHECTDEIVCPYCGYKHPDSWEIGECQAAFTMYCNECDKEFQVSRDVEVTYTTEKYED